MSPRCAADGNAGMTHTPFCLQKKKSKAPVMATTTPTYMPAQLVATCERCIQVPAQALRNIRFVCRKNKTRLSYPEQALLPACKNCKQIAAKPARLWKRSCISTGPDVQNSRFFCSPAFCPTSVQHRYNACPAAPRVRKPLTL
jgi:hypothetical protein